MQSVNYIAAELPVHKLPTNSDVINAVLFESKKSSAQQAEKIVVEKICKLWHDTSIPIVSVRTVSRKVSAIFSNYKLIVNSKDGPLIENSFKVRKRKMCITAIYVLFLFL